MRLMKRRRGVLGKDEVPFGGEGVYKGPGAITDTGIPFQCQIHPWDQPEISDKIIGAYNLKLPCIV